MPRAGAIDAEGGPEQVAQLLTRELAGYELARRFPLLDCLHERLSAVSLGDRQSDRRKFAVSAGEASK